MLRLDPYGPVRGWMTDRESDGTRLDDDRHVPRYRFLAARLGRILEPMRANTSYGRTERGRSAPALHVGSHADSALLCI
jgi:hypothetical protein